MTVKRYTTMTGIMLGILGVTISISAGNYTHIPNAAISGHNTKGELGTGHANRLKI